MFLSHSLFHTQQQSVSVSEHASHTAYSLLWPTCFILFTVLHHNENESLTVDERDLLRPAAAKRMSYAHLIFSSYWEVQCRV